MVKLRFKIKNGRLYCSSTPIKFNKITHKNSFKRLLKLCGIKYYN